MKTDFSARPVLSNGKTGSGAHDCSAIGCLRKNLEIKYTCRAILDTLKDMNFAQIEDQGFMPVYPGNKLTDEPP